MTEAEFIARLRKVASDPAARGLLDDTAVLAVAGSLVLTHDMIVEGVHFLSTDPPGDVAWKLIAVNLSDLAAKGAAPRGVLLGYPLSTDSWDTAFVDGLAVALDAMSVPLLGGDTVAYAGPRVLSLTAVGDAPPGGAPSRSGARAGDDIWISGTIGDAGAGLRIARGRAGPAALVERYRQPVPRIALGRALAAHVSAMMDVSDGLLIDLGRLCAASGVAADLDLDAVPLSDDLRDFAGGSRTARLAAVTAGDDYELLLTADPETAPALRVASNEAGVGITQIGTIEEGAGLRLNDKAGTVPLPIRLGYEHGAATD